MISMTVLVTLLGLSSVFGSSINIDVNHQYSEEGVKDGITIRCGLVKDHNCDKTSVTIQLSKENDKKIASVQGDNKIDYGRLQKQSVKAVGFIDHDDVSNSYLSVTIGHVMKEDSGLYTCSVFYLDYNGNFHYEKSSENITFENQNAEDLIKHLFAKISLLENVVEYEKRKTQQQISGLQSKVMENIGDLQNQSARFKEYLDLSPVAFSYGYNRNDDTKVIGGQTLLFTDLVMDLGGHFNPATGTFTAPIKGMYVFHLVVATWTNGDSIKLDLTSGTKIIATLHCNNKGAMDQSSVSTTVLLDSGEVVRPVVYSTSKDFIEFHRKYSYFTGYLMKPI